MSTVTKAELAKNLGCSKARVSQLVQRGLPVEPDGRVKLDVALNWVAAHSSAKRAPKAGGVLAGAKRATQAANPLDEAAPAAAPATGRGDLDGGVNPVGSGFSPDAFAILSTMQTRWPDLLRRAVLLFGGDELAAARAVAALHELVGYLALGLWDADTATFGCFSHVLPPGTALHGWTSSAAADLVRHFAIDGEPAWFEAPVGDRLADEMIEAGHAAYPALSAART